MLWKQIRTKGGAEMEKQEQNLLKDNHGVALTMVMALILIMTFLGGSMYAYTMQSLKTLEYGTNRQKAEYIARSGIEASVFMFQDALLKNDAEHAGVQEFLKKTDDDGVESTDETITTNWVVLLKDGTTYVNGGYGDEPNLPAEPYIGYYRVTITNDKQTYQMPKTHDDAGNPLTPDANGKYPTEPKTEYIKRFTSIGYCKDKRSVKKAYIVPLVDVTSKGWLDKTGAIDLESAASDSTSLVEKTYISINCGWIDDILKALKDLFDPNNKYPHGRVQNLPMPIGCTSGNMVIRAPKDEKDRQIPIHFKNTGRDASEDHAAGFLSMANLFIDGDINTEPSRKHFNTLLLRGNQIVINGNVDLYVYDPQTNSANGFTSWISGLAAKIARNYRFSTVVLGTPSTVTTTVVDPQPKSADGLGACGQVYFGGDVYVNFITRGGNTRRYKAFSAGETYYFDGDFTFKKQNEKTGVPYGVDLLKFFLDSEIEKKRMAPQVIQQFERTRNFYYDKESTVYSAGTKNGEPPSMRKVDPQKNRQYDSITDTVVPSPGDGTYIIWE